MVSETSVCSRLVLIFTFISAAPPAFTQALQPCNTSAAAVLTAAAVIAQTHWLLCHLLHKYSMDRTITTVTGPALPNVCPALYIHECNYSSVSELHWNLSHNKNHTARPSPPPTPLLLLLFPHRLSCLTLCGNEPLPLPADKISLFMYLFIVKQGI